MGNAYNHIPPFLQEYENGDIKRTSLVMEYDTYGIMGMGKTYLFVCKNYRDIIWQCEWIVSEYKYEDALPYDLSSHLKDHLDDEVVNELKKLYLSYDPEDKDFYGFDLYDMWVESLGECFLEKDQARDKRKPAPDADLQYICDALEPFPLGDVTGIFRLPAFFSWGFKLPGNKSEIAKYINEYNNTWGD